MFKALLLICATSVSDCNVDTALDVMHGRLAPTVQACLFEGMAMIAPTAVAPEKDGKTYLKIKCEHT